MTGRLPVGGKLTLNRAMLLTVAAAVLLVAPFLLPAISLPPVEAIDPGSQAASVMQSTLGGTQLWTSPFSNDTQAWEGSQPGVAADPDGDQVYAAVPVGSGGESESPPQILIAGFNATDGSLSWTNSSINASHDAPPPSLAVGPSGERVYMTTATDTDLSTGILTVAFDADTGETLWNRTLDPTRQWDIPTDIAVSPAGGQVFVGGTSAAPGGEDTRLTALAYAATDGTQQWVRRAEVSARSFPAATLTVSSDGSSLAISGPVDEDPQDFDEDSIAMTVSYVTDDGTERWNATYRVGSGNVPTHLAAGPNDNRLYVTIASEGRGTGSDMVTISYDALTGSEVWVDRYNGPASGDSVTTGTWTDGDEDFPGGIAVSGDGSRVIIGATHLVPRESLDSLLRDVDATDGTATNLATWGGPARGVDQVNTMATTPTKSLFILAGKSWTEDTGLDGFLRAYHSDGSFAWSTTDTGSGPGADSILQTAMDPKGDTVYTLALEDSSQASIQAYATGSV